MNNKGLVPAILLAKTMGVFAALCITTTLAVGGPDLLKKDAKSTWAGIQGKCQGPTPDSACIQRTDEITTVSAKSSIMNR
jgi:hypothetical protein